MRASNPIKRETICLSADCNNLIDGATVADIFGGQCPACLARNEARLQAYEKLKIKRINNEGGE